MKGRRRNAGDMLLENPLNESSLVFPVLECFHLLGIVCGVGTAALLNLRLLGVGMDRTSPAKLWRETMLWTLGGLLLAVFSGFLLFLIDPEMYYVNRVFRFKMGALAAAVGFFYTMVRRAAVGDREAPFVAGVSLALYALVPLGGILIGYN
jgi:hypothetical protein